MELAGAWHRTSKLSCSPLPKKSRHTAPPALAGSCGPSLAALSPLSCSGASLLAAALPLYPAGPCPSMLEPLCHPFAVPLPPQCEVPPAVHRHATVLTHDSLIPISYSSVELLQEGGETVI